MRRLSFALLFSGLLVSGYLVAATDVVSSWSDGMSGSSGAVPQHLRKCAEGFKYCKVKVSGCGGCHGDWDAMQVQRNSERPVIDRISAEIWLNGNKDTWEYTPGSRNPILIDIYIIDHMDREPGRYSKASFDLNASAGRFELFPNDPTLRITGGNFSHAGSKEPSHRICNPQNPSDCRQYGQTVDDESATAGDLTTTRRGSEIAKTQMPGGGEMAYHWRAKWYPPPRQEPNGAALVMAFMVPNSDAVDSCVHVECNSTKGYSDQNNWDWWSFMIPRKILCEKGANRAQCEKDVIAHILPPPPPVNTQGTDGNNGGDGGGNPVPAVPGEAFVALLVAGVMVLRRRPPKTLEAPVETQPI